MQPRPMAETVGPLSPSLRICIFNLLGPLVVPDARMRVPQGDDLTLGRYRRASVGFAFKCRTRGLVISLCQRAKSLAVLFVADLFHPVDILAVEGFRNRDMRHGGRRRRAVPMLLARWKPDDVAGTDFLDRPTFAVHPAEAGRDNQGLAERMGVPHGSGTGFESHMTAAHARRVADLKHWIDADGAGEPRFRAFARGA